MEGKVITVEARQLVGVGWTGPYSSAKEVRDLWKRFVARAGEIPNRVNPEVFISPCHGRKTDFTVYITAQVDPDEEAPLPQGMVCLTLPEQRYAVFTHQGPMNKVQDTYRALTGWLAQHGLQQDKDALWLEVYDQRYNPAGDEHMREDSAYEIYMPVK